MEKAILYVKSEKLEQVQYTMPNWGHWCSAGYRASRVDYGFNEEDEKAIEAVKNSGLECMIVDLGPQGVLAQIKAKIIGVNKTPTLVYKGEKFRGLEQILMVLNKRS
jgi:hypothetical protein